MAGRATALRNIALGMEPDAARELMEAAKLIETQAAQVAAAESLYGNRLGWSEGRNPYAPPYFWDELGKALGRDPAGFCSAEVQP